MRWRNLERVLGVASLVALAGFIILGWEVFILSFVVLSVLFIGSSVGDSWGAPLQGCDRRASILRIGWWFVMGLILLLFVVNVAITIE